MGSADDDLMFRISDWVLRASYCLLYGATAGTNSMAAATLKKLQFIRDQYPTVEKSNGRPCAKGCLSKQTSDRIADQPYFTSDEHEVDQNSLFRNKVVCSRGMEAAIRSQQRAKLCSAFSHNVHMVDDILAANGGDALTAAALDEDM